MRWLVDGMNVIGSRPDGWWRDREGAMARLVAQLERWAREGGGDVTVVFEGPPATPIAPGAVEVAHAPRRGRDAADDEIVRRLGTDGAAGDVRVVTSDRQLAERARAAGARVEPAGSFRALLDD